MHLFFRRFWAHKADVIHDCARIQEWFLQNDADIPAQMPMFDIVDVCAININRAGRAKIKPLQELHKARFARTRGTQDRDGLPRLCGEADLMQHVIIGIIAKADVLEFHAPADLRFFRPAWFLFLRDG